MPFRIRQKFIFDYHFTSLALLLFIVLFSFVLFPYMLTYRVAEAGVDWNYFPIYAIIFAVFYGFIVVFLLCSSTAKKSMYDVIFFDFIDDRVFYHSSYINYKENEIAYSQIVEVVLNVNVIQRFFKLGNIKIMTTASSVDAGMIMVDVENPEQQFEQINSIINNYKQSIHGTKNGHQ